MTTTTTIWKWTPELGIQTSSSDLPLDEAGAQEVADHSFKDDGSITFIAAGRGAWLMWERSAYEHLKEFVAALSSELSAYFDLPPPGSTLHP